MFPPAHASAKIQAIVEGERLSRAALYGWESPQVEKVLGEIARFADMSEEQAMKMVKETSDKAAEIALSYGVSEVCPLIPTSTRAAQRLKREPPSKILKGDPHLQLSILRELASATSDQLDVNTIFQMVLEGMHRGIGLERVAIAFINVRKLQAKYVLGEGTEHWRESFNFDIGPYSENVFTQSIEKGGAHWFNQEDLTSSSHLFPEAQVRILGKLPCFLSVMQIDNRKIAAFYADRWKHGGKLTSELFESFKHFANQAQTSLNLLSKSRQRTG